MKCVRCSSPLTGRQKKYCSEECSKINARESKLLTRYGISLEEYEIILAFQDGVCYICKRPPKPGQVLAVDHNHKTQKVRGLICLWDNRHNVAGRSDATILAMADYITNPPAPAALGKEVLAPPIKRKRKKRTKKEK